MNNSTRKSPLHSMSLVAGLTLAAAFIAPDALQADYMMITDLGTLPGGTNSYAVGVNASGQVAGYSSTASSSSHAFLYSGGGCDQTSWRA